MEEEKSEIELSDCIEDFVQAVWFFILNGNCSGTLIHAHIFFSKN